VSDTVAARGDPTGQVEVSDTTSTRRAR